MGIGQRVVWISGGSAGTDVLILQLDVLTCSPSLVVIVERDNAASCFQLIAKRSAKGITLKPLNKDTLGCPSRRVLYQRFYVFDQGIASVAMILLTSLWLFILLVLSMVKATQ